MLYKIVFLNVLQDSEKKTIVLESIFKFILRFILESILKVSSCEFCKIFKRTFSREQLRATASAVGLLIFYRYVEHLEGVITRYCESISTQIVFDRSLICFSMFLIVSEKIFRLMIFNTLSYLSLWHLHF